jgi:hypothetical protein
MRVDGVRYLAPDGVREAGVQVFSVRLPEPLGLPVPQVRSLASLN